MCVPKELLMVNNISYVNNDSELNFHTIEEWRSIYLFWEVAVTVVHLI